jgi:hypothetical protein
MRPHANKESIEMAQPTLQEYPPIQVEEQLHGLRDKCLTAFGNYAQEAQKTCALLGDLENPDSLDRLFAILEQMQVEEQAQTGYLLLRQQLFEMLGA